MNKTKQDLGRRCSAWKDFWLQKFSIPPSLRDRVKWTQTPLLGEPCVFRTSRSLLNCSRVAQFVPCCSVVPCCSFVPFCSICAIFVHRRHWATNCDPVLGHICAQETLSNELWPSLGNIWAQETLSNKLWPSLGNIWAQETLSNNCDPVLAIN